MKSTKTLRELCDELGVSRRAVQGYEKAGLVSATGRNKFGHLLYDEKSQKRIETIKLFQQFGFKVKEIGYLIEASNNEIEEALRKRIVYMYMEYEGKAVSIEKANEVLELIEKGIQIF